MLSRHKISQLYGIRNNTNSLYALFIYFKPVRGKDPQILMKFGMVVPLGLKDFEILQNCLLYKGSKFGFFKKKSACVNKS
jgi:hypothetical protein